MTNLDVQDQTSSSISLDSVQPGESCIVSSVAESSCICQLRCLGVVEGAMLDLIRSVSRGRLLILRVDGADMALRREVAATIQVRLRSIDES